MQVKGIEDILSQLRAAEALTAARPAAAPAGKPAEAGTDFAGTFKTALDRVSGAQNEALGLAKSFETGDKEVALHEVMLAMQKAGIAFQATVQVRNRLVSAYQDIMNMQI